MIKITYPPYQPGIKKKGNKEFIFDEVRKQWVLLTPEEWVRQNFLQYLIITKKYPATLIAVEKEFFLEDLKKRFDVVVYDRNTKPWMLIECKEMNVPINERVLGQALRYNIKLQVPYLVITNGSFCAGYNCSHGALTAIDELPEF